MDLQTPPKVVKRTQIIAVNKEKVCVICGVQIQNDKEVRKLFYKGTKNDHCFMIERLLEVEIAYPMSYTDSVCRNCLRQLITVEKKLSLFRGKFKATRYTYSLETSKCNETEERVSQDIGSASRRPYFTTPESERGCLQCVSRFYLYFGT